MAGTRRRRKENTGPVPVRYYDYSLVAVLVFLVCFGLVMLYSTSAYTALIENEDSMYYFKRQILFCGAGVVIIYVVSRINYHWYIGKAKAIYFFSLFLMFLVKTPLGKEVNGARRWIRLPMGQQFQPSELAKIAVILFIPVLICKMGKEFRSLQGVVKILAWGGVCAAAVKEGTVRPMFPSSWGIRPASSLSRASSRWGCSICWLPYSTARDWAAWMASRDFWVN